MSLNAYSVCGSLLRSGHEQKAAPTDFYPPVAEFPRLTLQQLLREWRRKSGKPPQIQAAERGLRDTRNPR